MSVLVLFEESEIERLTQCRAVDSTHLTGRLLSQQCDKQTS